MPAQRPAPPTPRVRTNLSIHTPPRRAGVACVGHDPLRAYGVCTRNNRLWVVAFGIEEQKLVTPASRYTHQLATLCTHPMSRRGKPRPSRPCRACSTALLFTAPETTSPHTRRTRHLHSPPSPPGGSRARPDALANALLARRLHASAGAAVATRRGRAVAPPLGIGCGCPASRAWVRSYNTTHIRCHGSPHVPAGAAVAARRGRAVASCPASRLKAGSTTCNAVVEHEVEHY